MLVAVSITETLPESVLATYTCEPSGLTSMPWRARPTGMVATAVLVVVSITDTSFDAWLLT